MSVDHTYKSSHAFANISTSPESESIPLTVRYVYPDNGKTAVNVHKHLLEGRAYQTGKLWTAEAEKEFQRPSNQNPEESNIPRNYPLEIGLKHHRSLVLYARWLYGRPMWEPKDCTRPNGDLVCLTDIYDLCAGDRYGEGRDYEAVNACLDSIRNLLVYDFSPFDSLDNPLGTLLGSLPEASFGRNMVIDLLIFGVCAEKGLSKAWLDNWHANLKDMGKSEARFQTSMIRVFLGEKAGEQRPDLMAQCTWHEHPSALDRLRCERASGSL